MFEIGKRYMYNAKKAIKNNVPDLYSSYVKYYRVDTKNNSLTLTGEIKAHPSHVLWSDDEPLTVDVIDGMGIKRSSIVQKIRVCRPFNGFEVTDIIVSANPGPFSLITQEMPKDGQKAFEDKFITDTVVEIMEELW